MVRRLGQLILSIVIVQFLAWTYFTNADDRPKAGPERLLPPALQPFEHLIGPWRGHGFLEANKQEGWDETATWGWRFEKSKIVGMEVTFKDGRYFSTARLDPLELGNYEGQFRLTATTPQEKEAIYEGSIKFGKNITFVRKSGEASAPDQLTLQLLHDVRYVMFVESKKGTAIKKLATIGATRADVRFGAAGKEEQGPKCIVTGAPGTSTVSHKGQTYYVCCSGCKGEFEVDPEKWLKLAKESKSKKEDGKSAESNASAKEATKDSARPKSSGDESKSKGTRTDPKKPAGKESTKEKEPDSESKSAAAVLARAKLLEKNGKRDAAIQAYERLLKEFPKAPEAKEATNRLKELRSKNDQP